MAAARSLFTGFIRNHKKTNGLVQRFTSSVVTKPEMGPEDDPDYSGGSDLRSRIFRLRLPKRSATNVIEKWVNEGNQITIHDLRQISKELRKEHRFKHALELSEWMVSRGEFELSDSDYAFRIDLMAKVFGIDAAERYFESLPLSAKTTETYTALLHCYAASKLTDKAEDLYERMKESNIPLSAMIYNELMTLYTSVGLAEKVSLVVEEMKKQNVSPDIYTYNLLISSCASALQIDDVRNILDEMAARELGPSESWARYVNLVKIYLTSGQLVDSKVNSVVEIEKGITQREWITYDFLIILHCALGNKDTLDRIWRSLKMTNQKMISRNYACILSAYLMLGHFNKVDEVISQWKTSATTDFDMSVCDRLTNAFEEVGMNEKASSFRVLLRDM
uniref:pentatricopeptide repeat-containing protein At5g09450, mitochondrial isoform X1 n=1 Tax=Erigeron canadensis TaxID=72917 RepID=UPI001CB9C631|nr:pentatricopeptide repeat-containing protein At5g09450, mitochondrial isoform X1 [Erigeron canadensis]XP_043627958.1 pentatricopeptide repeat-containing protein At5g09450, mitochondrial isoform X1 [Erigeron canadensis]XP_043627960.1 pentatricopeptide repeat-containing protein At5g09450, mitochondrial isoform X1 [Erigeron canadensis]